VKILSSFLIFALSSIHFLTAQNPLQEAVDNFKNNSIFNNASISFCAIDLSTGSMIAEYNPNLSLSPASIVKLFSTATAFEVLGSDYKPSTRIYIDGKIDSNGVLQGNLWIRGGGDPTLGSKYFNEEGKESQFLKIWCDTLKQLGIKNIAGSIVSDASQFGYTGIPEGWNWSDMGNYYGAGPSGLVIYDNMVKYTFKTGSYVGAKTELLSIFPSVPNFQFHNYITTSKKDGDNSFIFGAPYSLDRFGNGTLPLNSKAFVVKGSMPDPEFQIAYEFEKLLKENGITTEKGIKTARQMDVNKEYIRYRDDFELIYTHFGQSVLSIATHTNMKSVNLFAEELLCLSGIKDGSGLSRSNAISARHFCDLLQEMYKSSNYADFLSTLPLAGCSGTLSDVCKNQLGHGRIKAKSGTLNRVKAYSGYVDSESGKKIAFAIIVNNFNSSSSVVVDQMEKIFNVMATY